MLFPYQFVPHRIETLQVWINHLVKEVWCQAATDFSLALLHPDLRAVVEEIYNTEEDITRGKTGDWLHGPIKRIHQIFQHQLTSDQRQQVSAWYDNNNDIEALCSCDPARVPVTYTELRAIRADLADEIKAFCISLWSNVLGLKAVRSRVGEIDEHYEAFVAVNKAGKCPYCGYNDIKGTNHTRREAYDHFLPKGIYPFNSVNFRNLAPMCHECNSSYKLQLDATHHIDPISRKSTGARRKSFYTYAAASPSISISLSLNTQDVMKLSPDEIDLNLSSQGRDEEVEAWREVFGIDERYKAKCCAENDGKAWLGKVRDEHQNYGLTPEQMLAAEIRSAESRPWSDSNFLRKSFLEACLSAKVVR